MAVAAEFTWHSCCFFTKAIKEEKDSVFGKGIYRTKFMFGASLGNYIVVSVRHNRTVVMHEIGHRKQSLLLGPLYLLIIGLPSVTLNILSRLRLIDSKTYYSLYPENWADKLAGVIRG